MPTKDKKAKKRRFQENKDEAILIQIFQNPRVKTVRTEPSARATQLTEDIFSMNSSIKQSNGFNIFEQSSSPYEDHMDQMIFDRGNQIQHIWKNKTVEIPRKIAPPNVFHRSLETQESLQEQLGRRRKQDAFLDTMSSLPIKKFAVKGAT